MMRKWHAVHSRESQPKPKFLAMAEAYLSATSGPNFLHFFGLCLHLVSVVRAMGYIATLTKASIVSLY